MNRKIGLLCSVIIMSIQTSSIGQGCSDPGLCNVSIVMDTTKSIYDYSLEELYNPSSKLKFTQVIGIGENGTTIMTSELEGLVSLGYNIKGFVKLPFTYASGDLGSTNGLGDISIGSHFNLMDKGNKRLLGMLAFRVPTNDANITINGQALPMPYQTSLGTYDIIARGTFVTKNWLFTAGYQQVLVNKNNNTFENTGVPVDTASPYFTSNQLIRGNNVMVRVDRVFKLKKAVLFVGALPILKIEEDKVIHQGNEVSVKQSNGLTLNVTAGSYISLSDNLALRINAGMPLFTRIVRSDGLTRMGVIMAGIDFKL